MSCADLVSNSHPSILNVKSVPHDCCFLAPKLTKTPVVPALWSAVQRGSFWASSEVKVWFIEAGQSSLQTNCGSAGCVSAPRAFCCLGWIPSYTLQVAQMLDILQRSLFGQCQECLKVALFAAAPLRALQWLMTTGVVLLHCWKSNASPPPSHFLCWSKADKKEGSFSLCSKMMILNQRCANCLLWQLFLPFIPAVLRKELYQINMVQEACS